ncbi:MAG: 3-hydroxyacyl-CoA dehydrogenase NAD-binding domain-containing protein [Anaerolineales bacterium]
MANKDFSRIGVIGAGTMGSGIALASLYAGCDVILQDAFPQMLDKASDYIKKFLDKKGVGEKFKKLQLVGELEKLAPAQVVIEAAPEDMALKQDIFRKLDAICPPPAILATNTSTLSVTGIAAAAQSSGRVAGLHFFNPAPVLPLVEIVRAAQSSQETIETLVEFAKILGKTPVVTGDTPGFIVNRVARPFYGEALRILGEGIATHEQIDEIVEQSGGFKMGPFSLMDLIGIDINAGAMRSMYEQTFGEPRYRPHPIQMEKLAAGDLGRKTGRGFYEYGREEKEKGEGRKEKTSVGGSGRVLISEGSWAPGLAEMLTAAGYVVDSVPDPEHKPVACFIVAGRREEAERLAAWYDQSLSPDVPLLVQCADITRSEAAASWVQHPGRLVGFDGLFVIGSVFTLVSPKTETAEVCTQAERLIESLGKKAIWIGDGPAAVLPRIVCQLVNEAAFAQLEGVADGETIDLAMKLGVNYPKGPLEWGADIGYGKVLDVLDHLHAEYHEERYRACVAIRRWSREGLNDL